MKLIATILATASFMGTCSSPSKQRETSEASNTTDAIDRRFALATPNNAPVDAATYNRMVVARGYEHYCGTGSCDNLPQLVSGLAPTYPPALFAAKIAGNATLIFTINQKGEVMKVRVESASRPEFAEVSLEAIRTWKFVPAKLDGKPVSMVTRQQFPFELK